MNVVWVECQGTGTDTDAVQIEYQGTYRTGTDMGAVRVECQGNYGTDTDMDAVRVEHQGEYKTGTDVDESGKSVRIYTGKVRTWM